MKSRVEAYLALRRGLGFAYVKEGDLLLGFARYADKGRHHGPLTTALAVRWAKQSTSLNWRARRLDVLRGFARHEAAQDIRTEIPADGLLGSARRRRGQPHIYSERELTDLLRAAAALLPPGGLRPQTYTTFFGLLASTGLRVSEAIRLMQADVDLGGQVLRVSETKARKSRLVPLHPSTTRALATYAAERDRRHPRPQVSAFFLDGGGLPLKYNTVKDTFADLRRGLDWVRPASPGSRRRLRRIHDLRHSFACRRLLAWYEEGGDIHVKLPALSTYLGHVHVRDTYWYLTAIPDLMAVASARFERLAMGPS
jgi:integrase